MLGLWEMRIRWLADISEDYSLPLWEAMYVRSYYSDRSLSATAGIEESQVIERALPKTMSWSICPTTKDTACLELMDSKADQIGSRSTQSNQTGQQATDANDRGKGNAIVHCHKCNKYGC